MKVGKNGNLLSCLYDTNWYVMKFGGVKGPIFYKTFDGCSARLCWV